MTHLLWRQRALLRRYPPEGKRVLDFGCMDGVFTIRLQQLGRRGGGLRHLTRGHRAGQAVPRGGRAARVHHRAARARAVRPDLLQRGAGARGRTTRAWSASWWGIWRRAGRWWGPRRWGSTSGIPITSGLRRGAARGGRWRPGGGCGCIATTEARCGISSRSARRAPRCSSSRSRRRLLRAHADGVGGAVEHVGALQRATRSAPASALPPCPARPAGTPWAPAPRRCRIRRSASRPPAPEAGGSGACRAR